MAEMIPRHFVLGGIIFTMLIVGVFSVISLVNSGSPTGDGSDAVIGFAQSNQLTEFNKSFNKIDNFTTDVNKLKTKFTELKPEGALETITLPIAFITTAWAAISVVGDIFGFMNSSFEGLTAWLGIPSWIPTLIILIVIVVLVFGVLTIIFGKEA